VRVLVAMSGGVDSSVAAALLAEAGHDVVGVAMRVFDHADPARGRSCCGPDDLDDARAAARALGVPFYVMNLEEHFGRTVVDGFVRDYLALESLRLGPRLDVDWQLDPATLQDEIPPLSLQPLVENSVKHGLGPKVGGGTIRIGASAGTGRLRLQGVRRTTKDRTPD